MLEAHLPDMRYSAAVLAGGSDVLGFDTQMSMDHDWGPRVMLFLEREDFETRPQAIRALAIEHLPLAYKGYPLRIYAHEGRDIGARLRQRPNDPGLEPRIEIYTIHDFFQKQLGVDPDKPLSAADWLTMTHHRLRSMVDGRVFHDDVGLQAVRDRFCWYPHDVWLYVLASCWLRINEDETLTGRAGSVGDHLGSAVIAWHLIRDMMRLAFLMERSYPPYPKWLGSAFAQLQCAPTLLPLLERVGAALGLEGTRRSPCHGLSQACGNAQCTRTHAFGPLRAYASGGTPLHNQPGGGRLRMPCWREIHDPSVHAIAERWMIGSIDFIQRQPHVRR